MTTSGVVLKEYRLQSVKLKQHNVTRHHKEQDVPFLCGF